MRLATVLTLWIGLQACSPGGEGPLERADDRPNLLLVTLDTTRADRLGVYGYARDTSPELDRLAADGILHTRAWSTSTWTLPAHASLFTGRFPSSHGARYHPKGPLILSEAVDGAIDLLRAGRLDPQIPTLAERLGAAGWATGGIVAGPWLKRLFGLDRGFEHWDDDGIGHARGRIGAEVSDRAIAFVERHRARPWFLFLNYFDAHAPYGDPEGLDRLFRSDAGPDADERAKYDGEIRYADLQLGRVVERLRELGLYDDTWILVTADHGEMFGEHGIHGHGWNLYEPALRVPLVEKRPASVEQRPADGAKAPGAARSDAPIQLTDLMPLVLEGLGLEVPEGVQGRARADERPRPFAEVSPLPRRRWPSWRAWIAGDLKVLASNRGAVELYDLARDPDETRDLAAERPEADALARGLAGFADALPRAAAGGESLTVDPETREALRGLGYLEPREASTLEKVETR